MSQFDTLYNHLTNQQKLAVSWAKGNYRHWRKRFGESRASHNARCPAHVNPQAWAAWYDHPFGNPRFNSYVRTVRKLLTEGRI